MDFTSTPFPEPDTILDEDIPFYCGSCKKQYESRYKYHGHPTSSVKNKALFDPNMTVDTNDSNNTSCNICKKKYFNKEKYRKHVKRAHKDGNQTPVRGLSRAHPNIQLDINDPNLYSVPAKLLPELGIVI
jgi:hypothetical protein